jgi:hypothetical protein
LRTIQNAVCALYGELEDMEAVSLEEQRCGSDEKKKNIFICEVRERALGAGYGRRG